MKKNKKKGFTLVELLAVIVILAIVLVIAVPKVMDVIKDSKKATLESTAKMIASTAEKVKVQNDLLGKTEELECKSVAKINDIDYADCKVDFDGNIAKVSIKGKGKFAGLHVCNGTKTNATATDEECSGSTGSVEVGEFGKDSWETIVAAVKQAYENGEEYPYNVGDEKTINLGTTLGTHTIRIANKTKCSTLDAEGKSVTSKTACGFVLEFADIITNHNMNGTNSSSSTNVGGWPASEMRKYINDIDASDNTDGVIYNALPDALKRGIIETDVVSSHGSDDEGTIGENKNFGSTDKLYLLSAYEVWESNLGGYDTSATNTITRQLDYYAEYKGIDSNGAEYTGVSTSNYGGAIKYSGTTASNWWLSSAVTYSDRYFCRVGDTGRWNDEDSYNSYGVSPAFRLAN